MRSINPKVHFIFYVVLIEGIVLLFSTGISAGPCGPTDTFSGFMLLFTILFHIPGLIVGGPVYLLFNYFLPSPWNASALVIGAISGNTLFLSWLIYKIRKMRRPSYS
jgi:hypothetical protein